MATTSKTKGQSSEEEKAEITPANTTDVTTVVGMYNAYGEPIPMIYSALAAIMEETKAIGKNEVNQQQGFKFRGIDSIMNELHSIFARNKVFIVPEVLDYAVVEKTTGRGTILYYTRAKIKFHFTTIDGSEVVSTNVGEAMDSGDKGMNKAMSIALKYALMQLLLIPTQEDKDPDATTPEETRPQTIAEIAAGLDPVKDGVLRSALNEMIAAASKEALIEVWKRYSEQLKNIPIFTQCLTARKKELGIK